MTAFLRGACGCNTGRVRRNNEDNFLFGAACMRSDNQGLPQIRVDESPSVARRFAAIFDGMGGENFGELASFAAANAMRKDLPRLEESGNSVEDDFDGLCQKLNGEVVSAANELLTTHMGTTMVAFCFTGDTAYACNLGDSRAYVLRDGQLVQMSEDHVEARGSGKKSPLTQHLGIDPEELLLEPHISSCRIKELDQYLLCSDGLTDMLSDEEIAGIMTASAAPEECVRDLIDAALKNGGRDNVTVIVYKAMPGEKKPVNRGWLIGAAAAALCCVLLGTVFLLRKKPETPVPAEEPPAVAAATTVPEPGGNTDADKTASDEEAVFAEPSPEAGPGEEEAPDENETPDEEEEVPGEEDIFGENENLGEADLFDGDWDSWQSGSGETPAGGNAEISLESEDVECSLADGVMYLSGSGAFDDAEWASRRASVTELRVGKGVSGLEQLPLWEYTSLERIIVDPENYWYSSTVWSGVLFSRDQTSLIWYPAGKTDRQYTLPPFVQVIGKNAFRGNRYLEQLIISKESMLHLVCEKAFQGCASLREVVCPGGSSFFSNVEIKPGNDDLEGATIKVFLRIRN